MPGCVGFGAFELDGCAAGWRESPVRCSPWPLMRPCVQRNRAEPTNGDYVSDDAHELDKNTAMQLFEHFAYNNQWNQHTDDASYKRVYSSLAFALRGTKIRAALVAPGDEAHKFLVLTDKLVLVTQYQRRQDAAKPFVEVRSLRDLKRLQVATAGSLFSTEFGLPAWPRGLELEADFGDGWFQFEPYLKDINSSYRASITTTVYETLSSHL